MQARRWNASSNVLLLLCAMYLITYVDRVNISSAAAAYAMRPDQTFASDAAKGRAALA